MSYRNGIRRTRAFADGWPYAVYDKHTGDSPTMLVSATYTPCRTWPVSRRELILRLLPFCGRCRCSNLNVRRADGSR